MKVLVVYKSISGFTGKYAEWIAAALAADCLSLEKLKTAAVRDYDWVVFGGSLHAVGINGYKKFKTHLPKFGNAKVLVFAVGASPARTGIEAEIRSANLTEAGEQDIPLFYLRGGFDYAKLDFFNKLLMQLLKWKLTIKKHRTADEQGMLNAYSTPLDAAKQKYIEPIVRYITSAQQQAGAD